MPSNGGPPIGIDVEGKIRSFIDAEILFQESHNGLTNETRLLEGTLDSLALIQLVAFLEEEFQVEIEDSEITRDHFSTITQIGDLVKQRIAA